MLGDLGHQVGVFPLVGLDDGGVGRTTAVGEVVGAGGERAGDHDRGVDAEADQFGGVADGEGVGGGLGGEVGAQIRWCAAASAAAADPDQQAPALAAQVGQGSAVDPLRAEDVG